MPLPTVTFLEWTCIPTFHCYRQGGGVDEVCGDLVELDILSGRNDGVIDNVA
jgi:hypothetical protein